MQVLRRAACVQVGDGAAVSGRARTAGRGRGARGRVGARGGGTLQRRRRQQQRGPGPRPPPVARAGAAPISGPIIHGAAVSVGRAARAASRVARRSRARPVAADPARPLPPPPPPGRRGGRSGRRPGRRWGRGGQGGWRRRRHDRQHPAAAGAPEEADGQQAARRVSGPARPSLGTSPRDPANVPERCVPFGWQIGGSGRGAEARPGGQDWAPRAVSCARPRQAGARAWAASPWPRRRPRAPRLPGSPLSPSIPSVSPRSAPPALVTVVSPDPHCLPDPPAPLRVPIACADPPLSAPVPTASLDPRRLPQIPACSP